MPVTSQSGCCLSSWLEIVQKLSCYVPSPSQQQLEKYRHQVLPYNTFVTFPLKCVQFGLISSGAFSLLNWMKQMDTQAMLAHIIAYGLISKKLVLNLLR